MGSLNPLVHPRQGALSEKTWIVSEQLETQTSRVVAS